MASKNPKTNGTPTPKTNGIPPVPILEKFFKNLKGVLIRSNNDITALDDYELDDEFIRFIISDYFKEKNIAIKTISNIQVYEGPQTSSISSNLSVRFDYIVLQQGISEEGHMDLFFKVPPYGGYNFNLLNTNNLNAKENKVYSELFRDFTVFLGTPLRPYNPVIPEVVFASTDFENPENNLLVVKNLVDAGYYCPRDRFLDKLELKSVLKVLAKFHADGIAFKRKNPNLYHNQDHTYIVQYPFLKIDSMHRPDYLQALIDKYFDPYIHYLEKHYPYVKPALLLLKEMKSTIVDRLFGASGEVPPAFKTICHSNLWNGNLFLKKTDLICHDVKLVDWTHCQIASFTSDIVHTIFNCCSTDIMNDWSDLLNEYYDFFKMYLKEHNLDRSNLKIDFDTFWNEVAKSVKSEFVHLSVLTPLAILCGQHMAEEEKNKENEVNALFENDLVEEDVLPILEMAMALGLTKCIEKLAPELYKEETRRGSILSGKLVTRKESMKEPVPACIRRKRQSLIPSKNERSGSVSVKRSRSLSRRNSEGDTGKVTELCHAINVANAISSANLNHVRQKRRSSVPVDGSVNLEDNRDNISGGASGRTTPGCLSRKDSLSEDAMEALKRFQLTNPKMGSCSPSRQSPSNQQETLGNALKMIKKRRSLFEHASVFGYGTW